MRFETDGYCNCNNCSSGLRLHENNNIQLARIGRIGCQNLTCGSLGLSKNPNNTTQPPCLLVVDVNGDRKPSPRNANCNNATCGANNSLAIQPNSKKVGDIFSIMITDSAAIPYGVVAQRAMYQAQK